MPDIRLNVWNHVAVTREGNTFKLHWNGSAVDRASLATDLSVSTPLLIGRRSDARGYFLKGLVDEVGIYDRALTDDEIKAIYDSGSAGIVRPRPSPTATLTPLPVTATPTLTRTPTPVPTFSSTPLPTPTHIPTPTATPTPAPTATSTITPQPLGTPTPATLTGLVLYNGRPIVNFTGVEPAPGWFWVRNEDTGQMFPSNPSFDSSTGT